MKKSSIAEQTLAAQVRMIQQCIDEIQHQRGMLSAQIDALTAQRDRMEDELSERMNARKRASEGAKARSSGVMKAFGP